ncbi:MAG TPA: D-alanine--D-alanine ligase [Planctomycetaceae bacterium]|nr:D-alanine--D-alanine ligase [Planctomycetaceae bacterium]
MGMLRANRDPRPPLRVAVLLGGMSAEREVSLKSGAAVSAALGASGHTVVEIDPAQLDLAKYDWSAVDVAFIALHGRFGEDGTVQQILEDARIPYTGSDVAASRLAISKSATKERFLQAGVPTAPYTLIHESDSAHHITQHALALGFPLVVKPDTQGSSLGVTIVPSLELLPVALTRCFQYDPFGILETWIDGTEWTAGFVDDLALPLIRIETDRQFFDFEAKYEDDGTRYRFDGKLPDEIQEQLARAAADARRAVGTRGIARIDLMVDADDRPWVLEVNTVPGMTDHSLVPKAAAEAGIDFTELCERCLQSALKQSRRRDAA